MNAKLVLQDKKTGLYFKDGGQWTECPDAALDFENTTAAERLCRERGISHVRAIAHFRKTAYRLELMHGY